MKDVSLDALKKARDKCASSVGKSELKQLDEAIEELESNMKKNASRSAIMKVVVRIFVLMRFLAEFDGS